MKHAKGGFPIESKRYMALKKDRIHCVRHDSVDPCPLHWHMFYEIELCLSGQGTSTINGVEYPVRSGFVSLLRLTDFHDLAYGPGTSVHLVQIPSQFLPEDVVRSLVSTPYNLTAYLDAEQLDLLDTICTQLEVLSRSTNDNCVLLTRYYMYIVIYTLLNCFHIETAKQVETGRTQKILLFLQEHFRDNTVVGALTEQFYLNDHYLRLRFREETGISLSNYLKKLRLEYAYQLVLKTKVGSTEIAFECGYGSVSNFLRDFKAMYGFSPNNIRKMARK